MISSSTHGYGVKDTSLRMEFAGLNWWDYKAMSWVWTFSALKGLEMIKGWLESMEVGELEGFTYL